MGDAEATYRPGVKEDRGSDKEGQLRGSPLQAEETA